MARFCLGDPITLEPCGEIQDGPRCERHERVKERSRPGREIYRGDWPAESKAIRAAQPWCSVDGCPSTDLTVDHPTRKVFCRHHHGELEAQRRSDARAAAARAGNV